jgi:hypothetical protein
MKKLILIKKSANYYNTMDSIVNYTNNGLKCQLKNIFRFENPSYGFNVEQGLTYISPDINSTTQQNRFIIKEDLIEGYLQKYPIIFVGVVGNRQDLYTKNGIYQSNIMIRNISLYTVNTDGSFIDVVRSLKFDTSHPDMVFYPLCTYVQMKSSNLMMCILNDELMTVQKIVDVQESDMNTIDYPYIIVDPHTGIIKNELFECEPITPNVSVIKNMILLPKDKKEVEFKIFKDFFVKYINNLGEITKVETSGIVAVVDNIVNIKVTEQFTPVKIKVDLSDLFNYAKAGEKLEFEFLIISR